MRVDPETYVQGYLSRRSVPSPTLDNAISTGMSTFGVPRDGRSAIALLEAAAGFLEGGKTPAQLQLEANAIVNGGGQAATRVQTAW